MALVQLADLEDRFVGHKERHLLEDTDIFRIIVINITDPSGKFVLIQQRSLLKPTAPGLWTPAVSGCLDPGDTYDSCAQRELMEELGISEVELRRERKVYCRNGINVGSRHVMLYGATIAMDTPLVLQEEEVQAVRWVSLDELRDWAGEHPEDFTPISLVEWEL